jgi:2Fe-2S ferredoxin
MGGVNPYIKPGETAAATQPFQVEVKGLATPIHVDPARIPYGRDGLPGSLLDILLNHKVPVDHACGGVAACSTCHVIVRKGLGSCNPAEEAEEDMLDTAPGLTPQSRLACQCVPDGSTDLVVEVPSWNRNFVKESDL